MTDDDRLGRDVRFGGRTVFVRAAFRTDSAELDRYDRLVAGCAEAIGRGFTIAVPRTVRRAPVAAICGARPRRGDGSLWCELPPGHSGLHYGDKMHFESRIPRQRVTASGYAVAEAPQRRSTR